MASEAAATSLPGLRWNEEGKGFIEEQKLQFERDGYLVIEDWLTVEDCEGLKSEIAGLLDSFDPAAHYKSVFSTTEQTHTSDEYFLKSGGYNGFFFEKDAFTIEGELKQAKELSINKIGHVLHDTLPVCEKVSYDSRIKDIMNTFFKVPMAVQSMYIFKQPRIGGEVIPHQDGTFLITEPQSCIGVWWPLEDCTKENGCLWAVPGSHKDGVQRLFIRNPAGNGTIFEGGDEKFDLTGAVPLEIPKGSMVILHGAVVHYSEHNHSDKSRQAYSVHYVEGGEGFEFSKKNWLQRPKEFPFRKLNDA
jgi:phytanoyl-CoA hydroxylase